MFHTPDKSALTSLKSEILAPTLSETEFADRFVALHKQLWCTTEDSFDDVTTHVFTPPKPYYQVDHTIIHDGQNWHLYYLTGDMRLSEPWNKCRRARDWEGAAKLCVEPGNGHAVGKTLFDLKFVENVFFPSQGRFDLGSRGDGNLFRFGGRYGMLYDARGERGEVMCLAWSDDLYRWEQDARNPVLTTPSWANPAAAFKNSHVMLHKGVYLIYLVAWDRVGRPCIGLIATADWEKYTDLGPVFSMTPALRGTFGLESPQVVLRDGMWHLFFTQGPGLYHAVSPSPMGFQQGDAVSAARVARGAYHMGHFHATEFVEHNGNWWMTTDRKEETRRLNRLAGRMCYRGSYEDEKTLEEGLYLSKVVWDGDRPTLHKSRRPEQLTTQEKFP